jgi:hypothetical protein
MRTGRIGVVAALDEVCPPADTRRAPVSAFVMTRSCGVVEEMAAQI